ncbi:MAG TPA: NAD kinase [Gordonia sp. (in: high G+C Gram-positive bacteria)]|mgnify:CR=1 FL=1|uniref:NAD kinase n=1 Tax=unclassified Gordonia (in: high G+C Gram-positive bacteria) TaxID=2657482 RepID=UPI000FAD1560|nr:MULTISPECIES: NAD kinase [unclassified Gordonia (in: high G+C Gram-positive bacteria)]RUP40147.1 MAG: NAD kinase [Gordonia sp. (in: high G+C Gram-positive bacteria)]HNP59044.1 NAD kinase [Gordonia sp. (in: high G+C Gram-positive bacteria)]HRC52753.1 NAD kinase [Gordonia sp. (in: high G+C Gram-positive bacteria)]
MSDVQGTDARAFVVVAHTGRDELATALEAIARRCADGGVALRIVDTDKRDHVVRSRVDLERLAALGATVARVEPDESAARGAEVVIALGGDGTFLRAAELAQPADVPVLGINLGHIGFLAEAEAGSIDEVMERLVDGRYTIEPRMTLDVAVVGPDGVTVARTWALNEVVVQNDTHRGVLELVTEVDGRPVSAFGADGILIATPTGSTAYAFSAGGPVMWPDLEAILVVPSNAHALFARPMVTSPHSRVAVEVESSHPAIAICDGRRSFPLPPGARIEAVRSERSVKWLRIDAEPFADRLVTKFSLPVTGWRGRGR